MMITGLVHTINSLRFVFTFLCFAQVGLRLDPGTCIFSYTLLANMLTAATNLTLDLTH